MTPDDFHDLGLCPDCERDMTAGELHTADCPAAIAQDHEDGDHSGCDHPVARGHEDEDGPSLSAALRAVEVADDPDALYEANEALYGAAKDVTTTILAHVPSLSDSDEIEIIRLASNALFGDGDVADLAIRTCSCGVHLDSVYGYVDHLVAVFGGESHIGG